MLEISPVTWEVTIGLIVALLAVDLVLAAIRPHKVGFKEATAWSVFYILVAVAFGVWFGRSTLKSRFAAALCCRQFAALIASRCPYEPKA